MRVVSWLLDRVAGKPSAPPVCDVVLDARLTVRGLKPTVAERAALRARKAARQAGGAR